MERSGFPASPVSVSPSGKLLQNGADALPSDDARSCTTHGLGEFAAPVSGDVVQPSMSSAGAIANVFAARSPPQARVPAERDPPRCATPSTRRTTC